MTKFKWYKGTEAHKACLSAILDLCDRRIVSFVIGDRNDTRWSSGPLTWLSGPIPTPAPVSQRPWLSVHQQDLPSETGEGRTQSMSRAAHCIDNRPMEGFWGILKRERYYGRRFASKKELLEMIWNYIRITTQSVFSAI